LEDEELKHVTIPYILGRNCFSKSVVWQKTQNEEYRTCSWHCGQNIEG